MLCGKSKNNSKKHLSLIRECSAQYLILSLTHGFTLAEVLITLGIIGVVAAMTIPNLMTAFAKHRVETQLVKFYSTMNQAMRMSVADNGTPEGWVVSGKSYTYDETVTWMETYISPYLKHDIYQKCSKLYSSTPEKLCVNLINGGSLGILIDANGGDIVYFIDGDISNFSTKNRFMFQLSKVSGVDSSTINSQNFIEPYTFYWDGERDSLLTASRGCGVSRGNNYCTKLIQLNSWKIPSDYPW